MVTTVKYNPLLGVKEVIVGGSGVPVTVKFVVLVAVPPGVVTLIGPVVVPGAMVRVSWVTFTVALVPFTATVGAVARLLPMTVTTVPIGPLVGVKEVILGVAAYTSVPIQQR